MLKNNIFFYGELVGKCTVCTKDFEFAEKI